MATSFYRKPNGRQPFVSDQHIANGGMVALVSSKKWLLAM